MMTDPGDATADITAAQALVEKAERVILAFFYFLLFGLSVNNIWQYIIK